jgi:glyoxylase-like metal-dependent hydrolase (beta-lactamase superfamily II)
MSEPREVAEGVEEVVDGLYHWRIRNSAIGGNVSSSHALSTGDACVLVDPVRLDEDAMASLPRPTAIVLTARCHQRAAWRYRSQFGVEVWLPEDASASDEEPDRLYADGDVLPGGLVAVRTPGPEWPHYSLLLEGDPGVVFCSDLVMHASDGAVRFVPPEFHEDPSETRRSVEKLLGIPFGILCFDHGAPIVDDPKAALRRLLAAKG